MNRKASERLRASPNFSLTFDFDGRPYVAKDTEPYPQYWLSERDRLLLAMFSSRRGTTVDDAVDAYFRLTGAKRSASERNKSVKAVEAMLAAGVIVSMQGDTSRYTSAIVEAYVAHRPFPKDIAARIVEDGSITSTSEVLDLAGGPGDLALALARVSKRVSMLELSRGFLGAASKRARAAGLALTPILDSCNRLVYRDERYDVVTISQALHWMDDLLVCRGLCRCLRAGGSFFVVQGGFDVDEGHPLSYLLGARSILGHRPAQSFATQAHALSKRLSLLFQALDAPDVHRVDPAQQRADDGGAMPRVVPKSVTLYRQRRPMGLGFARGFLTAHHIEATGQSEQAFWQDVEARCAGRPDAQMFGTYHWALLHFRRDGRLVRRGEGGRKAIIEISF
jgi:2-polyprenyl-3-methyl-5-hydroxy-6-metoxy-1,4-benzoquinol methylase